VSVKIKVTLPSIDKKPSTGKGFFFHRLSEQLIKHGVDVFSDSKAKVDVALHNARVRKNNAKYNIVRIDGVYHNTAQDYKKLNKNVFSGFHTLPDAVIYQSNFSKSIADHYLGEFNGPITVISNGADPNFYLESIPSESLYEHTFITISRWRPHKRLKDIIESFLIADLSNSVLYVAGDINDSGLTPKEKKKYHREHSVKFLGKLDQGTLARYLISADVFIHLCWFDNCPNGVVEAICAGLPVITNNVGGTQEIVLKSGGYVVAIDKPYNLKPCDLYNPPAIDRVEIARYIIEASRYKSLKIDSSHVDIKNIAIKYKEFFEKIMESK